MTKVLIYIRNGVKFYGIVSPNGVKATSRKSLALICAGEPASSQMLLLGDLTEKQFRNKFDVIGSFMVESKQ